MLDLHLWRNRLARSAVNRKVAGSSPARCEGNIFFFLYFFCCLLGMQSLPDNFFFHLRYREHDKEQAKVFDVVPTIRNSIVIKR